MRLRLDYPHEALYLEADTPIEQSFRVNACAKEPWTAEWLKSLKPGDILYDIGANVGSYSLIGASRGATVIAIEPIAANYARLVQNIAINRLNERIVPLPMVLGESTAITRMPQSRLPGYSIPPADGLLLMAPKFSLDALREALGFPWPTHVKIDVDGNEAEVIAGATACLAEAHSVMLEARKGEDHTLDGFAVARRFTRRNGQEIGGVYYALYERIPEPALVGAS